jgi:hypothetical protein
VIGARFRNHLVRPLSAAGTTTNIAVPGVPLDWTGSPRIELGYRFADGAGVLVSYRSLVTSGTGSEAHFDPAGPGAIKSRLNLNVVDILYRRGPCQFAPLWQYTWDAGARIGTAYYDSTARGGVTEERITNNFIGGGPVGSFEVARQIAEVPGLALFGRLQGGVMFGEVSQSGDLTERSGGVPVFSAGSRGSHGQAVPFLAFFTGVSYTPAVRGRWMRFSFGYEFEQWWDVGDLGSSPSRADLSLQGIFFRGEFSF